MPTVNMWRSEAMCFGLRIERCAVLGSLTTVTVGHRVLGRDRPTGMVWDDDDLVGTASPHLYVIVRARGPMPVELDPACRMRPADHERNH